MNSAEKLVAYELCPRRFRWSSSYSAFRVSPIRALYMGLDAGLRSEKDPERAAENEVLALAATPGLDLTGENVYGVAMHMAKLAGILATALRSTSSGPWKPYPGTDTWESACYDLGDGKPRRIALVDRWSDDRKQEEMYGWRSLGEAVALDSTVALTAVVIGSVRDRHRYSHWTRAHQHPRNRLIRFQRKSSTEDFSSTWTPVWREDSSTTTEAWLTQMRKDGCMDDLIHTVKVPVPPRRGDYLAEMDRLAGEMESTAANPPMRLAGCFGFSPCPFGVVCHGTKEPKPENYNFRLRAIALG